MLAVEEKMSWLNARAGMLGNVYINDEERRGKSRRGGGEGGDVGVFNSSWGRYSLLGTEYSVHDCTPYVLLHPWFEG